VIFWRLGFQLDFGGNADTNREGGRGREREWSGAYRSASSSSLDAGLFCRFGNEEEDDPRGEGATCQRMKVGKRPIVGLVG
jgi:hypothetical protein